MTLSYEERLSDSPYIETITQGWSVADGSTIRPAECHWHMVFVRHNGKVQPIVVGPLTTSGVVSWKGSAEVLWLKFKLGTFIPHLPAERLRNKETILPGAASKSFWLKGSAWQFPDFNNAETFVDRLVRADLLVADPVVKSALQGHTPDMSPRTLRHRFLHTTGLTQSHIRQAERAQQAVTLLRQGKSILDTVEEAGYFDQPHLTRSLKQFIGRTPGQIIQSTKPEQLAILYKTATAS